MKNLVLYLLFLGAFLSSSAQDCVHYAVTGHDCSDSDFYLFDPTVPSITFIGSTGYSGITGMDVHPTTGVIYAVNGAGNCDDPTVLLTINPATGAATEIGPTGNKPISDISFNSSGVLYGFNPRNDELVIFDINTGAVTTQIPNIDHDESVSIAFDENDVLYLVDNEDVKTIDPSDGGVLTEVQNTNDTDDNENVSFFDANGNLITGEGESTFYFLFTDKDTGVDTEIGSVNERITAVTSCAFNQGAPIPTLGEWGMIILSLLVIVFGLIGIKYRQKSVLTA